MCRSLELKAHAKYSEKAAKIITGLRKLSNVLASPLETVCPCAKQKYVSCILRDALSVDKRGFQIRRSPERTQNKGRRNTSNEEPAQTGVLLLA